MSAPMPNVRQQDALNRAVEEAGYYGVEMTSRYQFDISFRPEVRPGRGHDIDFFFVDGEHIVVGSLDPYGNGQGINVGTIDWIHSGADENCLCEPCMSYENSLEGGS